MKTNIKVQESSKKPLLNHRQLSTQIKNISIYKSKKHFSKPSCLSKLFNYCSSKEKSSFLKNNKKNNLIHKNISKYTNTTKTINYKGLYNDDISTYFLSGSNNNNNNTNNNNNNDKIEGYKGFFTNHENELHEKYFNNIYNKKIFYLFGVSYLLSESKKNVNSNGNNDNEDDDNESFFINEKLIKNNKDNDTLNENEKIINNIDLDNSKIKVNLKSCKKENNNKKNNENFIKKYNDNNNDKSFEIYDFDNEKNVNYVINKFKCIDPNKSSRINIRLNERKNKAESKPKQKVKSKMQIQKKNKGIFSDFLCKDTFEFPNGENKNKNYNKINKIKIFHTQKHLSFNFLNNPKTKSDLNFNKTNINCLKKTRLNF